jgi:hypothetical protein
MGLMMRLLPIFMVSCLATTAGGADEEKINYDEAGVGSYQLPDPLAGVDSAAQWREHGRAKILDLFESQVYGRPLPKPARLKFDVEQSAAFGDKATRKRVRLKLDEPGGAFDLMTITIIVPRQAAPAPVFVGMHLFDTSVENPQPGRPLEGAVGERLPGAQLMETILARGYAVATLDAKDFCPDNKDQFRTGVLTHLFPDRSGPPGAEEPGAIATWAWGLSRALDCFETDPTIDARRVAVIGHSRMGKTALWAGAEDPRFAIVISNNSGCGGAALSRRIYGETVGRITRVFPHWFCGNFSCYAERENELPVDQHELIALIAPRPVYIASAEEDRWADPKGEFLAAAAADPVYRLLGCAGLGVSELPPVGKSVGQTIGYHLRRGPHALTDYDWLRYLDFADRHAGQPGTKRQP